MNRQTRRLVPVLLVLALVSASCAGTIRDRMRTSALMVGEAALDIDKMEQQIARANPPIYKSPEQAKQANTVLLRMLEAARAYERGVKAWPADMPDMPQNIWEAQSIALKAIAEAEHILAGLPGTEELFKLLTKLRGYLGG